MFTYSGVDNDNSARLPWIIEFSPPNAMSKSMGSVQHLSRVKRSRVHTPDYNLAPTLATHSRRQTLPWSNWQAATPIISPRVKTCGIHGRSLLQGSGCVVAHQSKGTVWVSLVPAWSLNTRPQRYGEEGELLVKRTYGVFYVVASLHSPCSTLYHLEDASVDQDAGTVQAEPGVCGVKWACSHPVNSVVNSPTSAIRGCSSSYL